MKRYAGMMLMSTFAMLVVAAGSPAADCIPTEPDMMGPFYRPGAPVRSSVGTGYVLTGTVKGAKNCTPVRGAVIEFWLAGPNGEYDDAHRATVVADESGGYRFESNAPKPYYGRPPHIHIRVSAEGYKTLVAQHYPEGRKREGVFDLVVESVP